MYDSFGYNDKLKHYIKKNIFLKTPIKKFFNKTLKIGKVRKYKHKGENKCNKTTFNKKLKNRMLIFKKKIRTLINSETPLPKN